AHHGELAAAAEREARDRGDDRLAHARKPLVVGRVVGTENVDIRLVRHLLDVGACGKGLVRTGHEDAADIGVGVEGLDRTEQLVPQGDVERIERLRSIEAHDADAAAPFDDDGLRAHGCPWLSFSRHAVTAPRARKVRVAGVATVHALRCFPVNNRENTGGAAGGGRSAERAPTARHVEVAPSIVNNNPETMERSRRSFPTAAGWFFTKPKGSSSRPSAARAWTHSHRRGLWGPPFPGPTRRPTPAV